MGEPQGRASGEGKCGFDAVIEVYKRDLDMSLIRENLRKTPDERLRDLERMVNQIEELREAMKRAKQDNG